MAGSEFVTIGIFELIAASVTFLGIILALDRRIIENYQELLQEQDERLNKLHIGIEAKIISECDRLVIELFYNIGFTKKRLEGGKRDYKYRHMLITVSGIVVLIIYGIVLLVEHPNMPFLHHFSIAAIVVMAGLCPTIFHLLIHRRVILNTVDTNTNHERWYEQLQDAIDNPPSDADLDMYSTSLSPV